MEQVSSVGDRVRNVRKRRGLTQRDLARSADVSLSLVKKLEEGEYGEMRLETVHKLAIALRVPTSALATGPDAAEPENGDVEQWAPVRRALEGSAPPSADSEPTLDGLRHAFDAAVSDVLASRYVEVRAALPALLRDTDALVSVSVNGTEAGARRIRSQVRQLTAYMMGQTWQFTVASEAIELAGDDAGDELTAAAAADWKCWIMIRQGRLGETRELATRLADEAEPRISRATPDELAAWGRLLILVSSAAVRDNRPGEAADALKLARVAAAASGRDAIPGFNPWDVFGPVTVAMVQAENAMIQDRPDVTLAIGERIDGSGFPVPRNWNRHRLDVANAHVSLKQYAEAVGVLQDVRRAAPEWLLQQRYARDILGRVVERRRSLTPDMRELADAVRLPL
jgi:transcriptional regulator with XRE-family HTH domain